MPTERSSTFKAARRDSSGARTTKRNIHQVFKVGSVWNEERVGGETLGRGERVASQ